MRKSEKEKLFQQHRALANRHAGRFARCYKIPESVLRCEADSLLGLIIAEWDSGTARAYNPDAGCSPTSWIYRRLYWDLLTLCTRKWPRHADVPTETCGTPLIPILPAPRSNWLGDLLRELGEDATTIVQTIVDAPGEILEDIVSADGGRVYAAIAEHLNWDEDRIDRAWTEVTSCLT